MGEAQALYGLTARALRFYEERGLVQACRDRFNRRYFDAKARRRLEWIARLRRSGVSLPDIQDVLDAEDARQDGAAVAAAKLEGLRRRLARELAAVEGALLELQQTSAPRQKPAVA